MKNHTVTIDLVTERPDGRGFVMVAIEEGPWSPEEVLPQLRRLQDRLYDFVDAAVDGFLANKYPDSKGKDVTIRLDCYNVPEAEIRPFFRRFAEGISESIEIREAIHVQGNVASLGFELNCRGIH